MATAGCSRSFVRGYVTRCGQNAVGWFHRALKSGCSVDSLSSNPYTVRTQALVTDCGSLHYPTTFLKRITGSCLTSNTPDHVDAVCAARVEPGRHSAQRWPLCPVRWRPFPCTRIRLAVGRRFPVGASAYGEEEEFCLCVLRHRVQGPTGSDGRVI